MKILASLLCLAALVSPALAQNKTVPDLATLKDKVNIALGDRMAVAFQQDKSSNALSQPKVLKPGEDKSHAVTFDFHGKDGVLTLITQNPFPKTLHFRALVRIKGRTNYFETSILPIMAGLMSGETWGDPIEDLILFDFKLSEDKP